VDPTLRNAAIWTYYRGADRLAGDRAGDTLSAALSGGWIWFIPLSNHLTSVGAVVGDMEIRVRRPAAIYDAAVSECPLVRELVRSGKRLEPVRVARDWSYLWKRFYGAGWLLVGDAAGFVDPILSTGLGMALQGAWAGAQALDAVLAGASEYETLQVYERFYKNYVTQFFDFVHYFYDANRHVDSYFWRARQLVDIRQNQTARNAFIHLIAGLNGAATTSTPLGRSFDMGVFDNVGSPYGSELLTRLRGGLSHFPSRVPDLRTSSTLPGQEFPRGRL
jgi:hypothetical protein